MRPGQSCPGVAGASSPLPIDPSPSFNEAGAIMPRSGADQHEDRLPVGRCFNEAGAIMPRSGLIADRRIVS